MGVVGCRWDPNQVSGGEFNSIRHEIQNVHHNNTECNTGNNIERENIRQGTGGKPLCKECAGLK